MTSPKVQYLIIAVVSLLALWLPHSDTFIIIFAFLSIPIIIFLLVLLIYFTVITIENRKSNQQKFIKGKTGVLAVVLIIILPFFSVFTVDAYYNFKAEQLIKKLEEHKIQHGEYPINVEQFNETNSFLNVRYIYYPYNKNYGLEYKSRGTVVTKYDNKYKHWRNYGWND